METIAAIIFSLVVVFLAWLRGYKSGSSDTENKKLKENKEARKNDTKIRDDVSRTSGDDLRDELRQQSKR